MSTLKDIISDQIKIAMKAQDKFRLSVLRMVLSDIKYAEVAVRSEKDGGEDIYLKAVEGYAKKLEKSLNDLPDAQKQADVRREIAVVQEFLPKKASREETLVAVEDVLAHVEERNFGALMKLVGEKLGGKGDSKIISGVLKEKLG